MIKKLYILFVFGLVGGCAFAPKLVDVSTLPNPAEIKTKWDEPKQFYWDKVEIVSVNGIFVRSTYSGGSVRINSGINKIITKATLIMGLELEVHLRRLLH